MQLTGAEIIVRALADLGVEVVFGYPGGAVLPIYDAIFRQNRVRHILVRHEQAAVHMAEGYARSTGRVGVVLVTSGPGATNTVTGLTDALMDSVPVLCLTGQVPTHLIGNDAFQEADTVGITRSCTKHNYLVKDIRQLVPVLAEAYAVAAKGRPGPVVVDLPKDIQNADLTYVAPTVKAVERYRPRERPAAPQVRAALDLLLRAERPVIYAGGGVVNSGPAACRALTRLVRETGFPVTTTLMGLGAVPASEPNFLGMLGMHGTYEANMAMHDCDVMLNVGARFDDRVTGRLDAFSPASKKIHIDIDPSSINKNVAVDVPVQGDAGRSINALRRGWKAERPRSRANGLDGWWRTIRGWQARDCLRYENSSERIKPQYALQRLDAALAGRDAYVTTEVGQHQMWAAQFLHFERPQRWMTSGGLGTMGYGFPAAVGTQVADPGRLVVCVAGEASFMMNLQELSTVQQYRLPVKIFIVNNEYLGMVRQWQEFFHGSRYAESYSDALPDFVELAESFGIKGLRADRPDTLDDLIAEMIDHDGPVLADIRVEKSENVFPMIPAGAAHNEMRLSADDEDGAEHTDEGLLLV